MTSIPRATCKSWSRDIKTKQSLKQVRKPEAYRVYPPDLFVVPQIFAEVSVLHSFEHKGEGMLFTGIDTKERCEAPVIDAIQIAAIESFLVEPLPATLIIQSRTFGAAVMLTKNAGKRLDDE
jgi:hypothetical protein